MPDMQQERDALGTGTSRSTSPPSPKQTKDPGNSNSNKDQGYKVIPTVTSPPGPRRLSMRDLTSRVLEGRRSSTEEKKECIKDIQELLLDQDKENESMQAVNLKGLSRARVSTLHRVRNRLTRLKSSVGQAPGKQNGKELDNIATAPDTQVPLSERLQQIHDLIQEFGEDELLSPNGCKSPESPDFDVAAWLQDVSQNNQQEEDEEQDSPTKENGKGGLPVKAPQGSRRNSDPGGFSRKKRSPSKEKFITTQSTPEKNAARREPSCSSDSSDFSDISDTGLAKRNPGRAADSKVQTEPCLPSKDSLLKTKKSSKSKGSKNSDASKQKPPCPKEQVQHPYNDAIKRTLPLSERPLPRRHTVQNGIKDLKVVSLPEIPTVQDLKKERVKKEDFLDNLDKLAKKANAKALDASPTALAPTPPDSPKLSQGRRRTTQF